MYVYHVLGLVLLWCGLISAYVLSSEELSSEEDDACVAESGVNVDDLDCLPHGPCPDIPQIKCFVKCRLIAFGMPIDEDGLIDPDDLLEGLDEDEKEASEAAVRLCAEIRGYDACDTTYQTYMCWSAKGLLYGSSEEESSEEKTVEAKTVEEETVEDRSSAEGSSEKWARWHEMCVDETEVDEDLLPCLFEGICGPDPKLKCYAKCLMTKAKVPVMEDGGLFDIEALIEDMSEEMREKHEPIVRECSAVGKGADDCDTAYLTVSCWILKWRAIKESLPETYQEILDRR